MDEDRQTGRRTIEEMLRDWGVDLEQFETRARRAAADAKDEYGEGLGILREKLAEAGLRLEEIRRASGPATAELRTGLEGALRELGKAFERAAERIREKRESEKHPPDEGPPAV